MQAHQTPSLQAPPCSQANIRPGIYRCSSLTEDYVDRTPDLDQPLVKRPAATYSVTNDSMEGVDIQDDDTLKGDRAAIQELPI